METSYHHPNRAVYGLHIAVFVEGCQVLLGECCYSSVAFYYCKYLSAIAPFWDLFRATCESENIQIKETTTMATQSPNTQFTIVVI